jgi:hypothetical protein
MNDHWACIGWIHVANTTQELQERSGVIRHTVVRPSCELELFYLPSF